MPKTLLALTFFGLSLGCASPKAHFQKQMLTLKAEKAAPALKVPKKSPTRVAILVAANSPSHSIKDAVLKKLKSSEKGKTRTGNPTALKSPGRAKNSLAGNNKAPSPSLRMKKAPVPMRLGSSPYRVFGVQYFPRNSSRGFDEEGLASWYGPKFHGRLTSNREVYDMHGMTAAHKTLPFDTHVKVINLENKLHAVVRINDRGPFVGDRLIDLSYAAAKKLKMSQKGIARVRVVALEKSSRPQGHSRRAKPRYAVQIAVFNNLKNARQLQRKLENNEIRAYSVKGPRKVRVLAGKYTDFNPAYQLQKKIRELGYSDALIVVNRKKGSSAP